MLKNLACGCLVVLAALAGADAPSGREEPSNPNVVEGCPEDGTDVVVEVVRFDGGVPSYAFRVTNNAEHPVRDLRLAEDGVLPPLLIAPETEPTSVGSPAGWTGYRHYLQDWRRPQQHSASFVTYYWGAKDEEAWIQPGESLSGFSVQLPAPTRPNPTWQGRPVLSDLTKIGFSAHRVRAPCMFAKGRVRLN